VKDGAHITVVYEGRCVRALAYPFGWFAYDVFGYSSVEPSGKLYAVDEDIRWTRGWLWRWWPPHKRRMRALEVADALVGPRKEENRHVVTPPVAAQTAINSANSMLRTFDRDVAKLMSDANKIVADAHRIVRDATTTTTWRVRITKR
jgi:hypothetical protein